VTAALFYNHQLGAYDLETQKERVLVFPANALYEQDWLDFQEKPIITRPMLVWNLSRQILDSGKLFYMDRDAAEVDPNFKQIIPYTVLLSGDQVFTYKRTKKGGEGRLHDKWSVGVGGHINPRDGDGNDARAYWQAFDRELEEEVGLRVSDHESVTRPIQAMLYDGSNDVGKVHFGFVHFVYVEPEWVKPSDPALAQGSFEPIEKVRFDKDRNFENWSRFVIDHAL